MRRWRRFRLQDSLIGRRSAGASSNALRRSGGGATIFGSMTRFCPPEHSAPERRAPPAWHKLPTNVCGREAIMAVAAPELAGATEDGSQFRIEATGGLPQPRTRLFKHA